MSYEPELAVITMKYLRAAVTLNTPFYYYNLTDTIPDKFCLMTDRGAAKNTNKALVASLSALILGNSMWQYPSDLCID